MKLDLQTIIDVAKLDAKETASQLFPSHNEPMRAFNRVVKGDQLLDSSQIAKLSFLTGLTYDELFNVGTWKAEANGEQMKLYKGDYIAEVDLQTLLTKVYHKGGLFQETVLNSTSIRFSEFLNNLNTIILNHEKTI